MTYAGFIGIMIPMKSCVDCGQSTTKTRCKPCGYKNRKRPSGLTYKLIKDNPTSFKKGFVPWNKGTAQPKVLKGRPFGVNHHNWRGDEADYTTKHQWVYKWLGKPLLCAHCLTTKPVKRFDWHNKSGQYLREYDDWVRLCSTCHGKEHQRINKLRKVVDNA